MPYVYVYQCNRCEADVEIVLSKEFRREPGGEAVDFEYPPPELYEWPPRRVSGLWSRLWCPRCKSLRPHVLVELDEPAEHPVQVFLAAEARGLTGGETGPCPTCDTQLLIDLEDEPCPHCEEGRMLSIGEYEP
jgi:hypothetical protein